MEGQLQCTPEVVVAEDNLARGRLVAADGLAQGRFVVADNPVPGNFVVADGLAQGSLVAVDGLVRCSLAAADNLALVTSRYTRVVVHTGMSQVGAARCNLESLNLESSWWDPENEYSVVPL